MHSFRKLFLKVPFVCLVAKANVNDACARAPQTLQLDGRACDEPERRRDDNEEGRLPSSTSAESERERERERVGNLNASESQEYSMYSQCCF